MTETDIAKMKDGEATDGEQTRRSLHCYPFRALSRDLYCDIECQCLDPAFADSGVAHLFKRKVKLIGYADDHFFDQVNAEPRELPCKCGRRLRYQWFRDRVEAEWMD